MTDGDSEAIARLEAQITRMDDKLDKVRTEDIPSIRVEVAREIAALKVKAGVWGVMGGAIVALGALLANLLRRGA